MSASNENSISILKNLFTGESILNEPPVKNWFLPENRLFENNKAPFAAYFTTGFNMNETRIHSILSSTDEKKISETNADGILTEFWLSPKVRKIKKILRITNKPLLINLIKRFGRKTKIIEDARNYELAGVSGVILNPSISLPFIEKIRKAISIPVISKSVAKIEDIEERHKAGADIIFLNGMDITPFLIECVKNKFPQLPIISYAGNSKELIINSLASGVNAIIFKPWSEADFT